ncbi:MAG TPA: acyl carrier protein [Planctomycetota bacterium]|nr:acyl carrier protein [Planctomycetota bacterium]
MSGGVDREPLRDYFTRLIGGDREMLPADDASLVDEGILDSFGLSELTAFVQATYGVRVADEHISFDHLGTIAKIAAYVGSRR